MLTVFLNFKALLDLNLCCSWLHSQDLSWGERLRLLEPLWDSGAVPRLDQQGARGLGTVLRERLEQGASLAPEEPPCKEGGNSAECGEPLAGSGVQQGEGGLVLPWEAGEPEPTP